VESCRVLGLDEVETELSLALELAGERELFVAAAGGHRRAEIPDQRDDRVHRLVAQQLRALLDRLDTRPQLLLRPAVTVWQALLMFSRGLRT